MFKPGDQIVYIPLHAKHIQDHPDREYGFVTATRFEHGIVFCRYWSKFHPSGLRTRTNSEATPTESLRLHKSKPQWIVDSLIKRIENGEEVQTI